MRFPFGWPWLTFFCSNIKRERERERERERFTLYCDVRIRTNCITKSEMKSVRWKKVIIEVHEPSNCSVGHVKLHQSGQCCHSNKDGNKVNPVFVGICSSGALGGWPTPRSCTHSLTTIPTHHPTTAAASLVMECTICRFTKYARNPLNNQNQLSWLKPSLI